MRLSSRPTLGALARMTVVALALGAVPARSAEPLPSLADILRTSKPADWRALEPANTLYMELASGRVVIELAPTFAPNHVDNIRKLVREGYFDGLSILRSQENYVVQWGDPDEAHPRALKTARHNLPGEFTIALANDRAFTRMPDSDGYAPQVGYSNGFPSARDPASGRAWLTHCYGMVGVGRDNSADSGDGSALYVVTGQAPRQLDRNITLVGRVIAGMPLLTTLPRGAGAMGFYDKPEQMVPIKAVRLAADVPESERSPLEVVRTDSPTFEAALATLRNRGGDWYKVPAGHIDVCNVPLMVRAQAAPH